MGASEAEESALRYVPGRGPVSIARLASGLVNESYRVVREGRAYSLRIPAPNPVRLGVDREWECRVLGVASAAGIAPAIVRCEPREGVLVARWVEGGVISAAQARRPPTTAELARLARRVHALSAPVPPRICGPRDWIRRYAEALSITAAGRRMAAGAATRFLEERAGLEVAAEQQLKALESLPPPALVLCHSDLHAANLVAAEGGFILLDWEYAHVSEALWDLAGWTCNNDLDAGASACFLESYLGRAPTAGEEQRFAHLAWLYDYVCVLWSAVYLATTSAPDARILDRARVCASRIQHGAGGGAAELPAN